MSEKVKQAIKENILNPELDKKAKTQIGKVKHSYYEMKKILEGSDKKVEKFNVPVVDVEVIDDRFNERRELKGVPIMHSALSSNLDGRKVQKGDRVLIAFYRDNDAHPYVLGRLYARDDELEKEMRVEKGAYKSDAKGHF